MQAALHAADADAGGGLLAKIESLGIEDQMSWDVVAWPSEEKITNYLVAAYCPVIASQTGLSKAQMQTALQDFIAGAQPIINAPAPKTN